MIMDTSSLENLKLEFAGSIILPSDDEYKTAANIIAAPGTPQLIVRPQNTKDVLVAIKFATTNKLVVSVRSGGHSMAGFSTNTDGVVIDLSLLHTIDIIDSDAHIVRIGPGATWEKVASELQKDNLAISSGDTKSVGVGGLTLGGGIGWMVRKYGLSIDSLVGAQVATASGQLINVSQKENADLFWAIRGGGGNFGIVTHFDFVAHEIGNVYAGPILFERKDEREFLKKWRDYMRTADNNLTTILSVMPSFGESKPMLILNMCFTNDNKDQAQAVIDSLKQLGNVTHVDVKEKQYGDVLEPMRPPPPIKVIVDNVLMENFSDEVIDAVITALKEKPDMMLQIRSLQGALNTVSPDATAFGYRKSEVMILCPTFLPPNASNADIEKILAPWKTLASKGKGSYSNFISTRTPQDVERIYPPATMEKLKVVKKKYDPENIFNQNYNIQL